MRRRFVQAALLAALFAGGCAPDPVAPANAAAVAADGAQLIQVAAAGDIPRAQWPASIAALQPDGVYATADGLYICMSGRFVDERGFFVPRDRSSFAPQPGTDPAYTPVAAGLYAYEIKG